MRLHSARSLRFDLKKLLLPLAISATLGACVTGGGGSPSADPPPPALTGTNSPVGPSSSLNQQITAPGVGTGKTYYVSTTGSDANDGLSLQTPLQTLAKAVSLVNPGDTIEMEGGTYVGAVIDRPGSANAWITLEPYNGQQVTIDGSSLQQDVYFYNNSFAPMYWIMRNLTISGGQSYAVKIDTPDVKLVGNKITASHDDLVKLVSTAHDIVIYGNEIYANNAPLGANAQGIDMVGSQNVWVAHNYVHDIVSISMYAKGNARNIVFEDNRVDNGHDRGIMLGQSTGIQYLQPGQTYESYDSVIRNNIITNTADACLATSSSYNPQIYNNTCYNADTTSGHGGIFISNESLLGQAGTNISIENNLVVMSSTNAAVMIGPNALTSPGTLHMDHNLYWNTNGAPAVTFSWDDLNDYNIPLAQWQGLGQDLHSVVADPQFASLSTFALSPGSPAINAGASLPSVTNDYYGNTRPSGQPYDIGAVQQ